MTMPSSVEAVRRRADAVTFAGPTGQSTGALLIPAGVAAPGSGHPDGARAGLVSLAARGGFRRPSRNVSARCRPGR